MATTWRDGTSTGRTGSAFETSVKTTSSITGSSSTVTLTSGQVYRDAVFDASALTASSAFTGSNLTNVLIENVRITNLAKTKTAFQFTDCDHVVVRNCTIESGGRGITFDSCDDVIAENNDITLTTDATSGFTGHGVLFYANDEAHSRCRIHNNRIVAVKNYAHGIYAWGSNAATVANPVYASDISIVGNVVDTAEGGIWTSKCQRVSVAGNTILECDDVGIDFEGSLDCVASGNAVHNGKNGALATLYNSKRIAFTGNTVTSDLTTLLGGGNLPDTSNTFAYIRDQNEDVLIEGNVFASTGASVQGEITVWKNAQSEASARVTIRGNTFRNGAVSFLGLSRNLAVEGNTFYHDYEPTDATVSVVQSDGVIVRDNRFSLASDAAANTRGESPIQIYQNSASSTPRVTNVVVEGNQIQNWPSVGIEIDTYNGTNYTATFIIRNNQVGNYWTRTSAAATKLITGNVLPTAPQTASTANTW